MARPRSLGEYRIKLDELRLDAKRLKAEFDRGDALAPFECCWLWNQADIPAKELPGWVLDHLASIAADYFNAGPTRISEADLDDDGNVIREGAVSPRDYINMTSKKRHRITPSLDKVAGLSGTQGKANAWKWRAEHGFDLYIAAYLDKLTQQAISGDNTWVIPDGERAGKTMPILDNSKHLRDPVRDEVARLFRVGGFTGDNWNKAMTIRRRVRSVRHSDK